MVAHLWLFSQQLTNICVQRWFLQTKILLQASHPRSHTGKQTWWLWWCTSLSGPASPARSSPPLPPAWLGPALGSPTSAAPSPGRNAAPWSGAVLAFLPGERSEGCHRSGATPTPGTWPEEQTGWTPRPGSGRRRNWVSACTPCCPVDRGFVRNACAKQSMVGNVVENESKHLLKKMTEWPRSRGAVRLQSKATGINIWMWKLDSYMGDVFTYVAFGILGQSTRTHWKPPYVLMHIWSFVQLFCLVAHSSISVVERRQGTQLSSCPNLLHAFSS